MAKISFHLLLCAFLAFSLQITSTRGFPHDQDPRSSIDLSGPDLERRVEAQHEPVPISIELYKKTQVYANYSSASSYEHCPHPPYGSTIVKFINVNRTTTQVVLFRDDIRKEIIVAFPGTHGRIDVLLDKLDELTPYISPGITKDRCKHCHVHRGFLIAWNSVANRTANALSAALHRHPSYSIIVTGHSLGAALASLATASLHGQGFPIAETYTFGQPRTGDPNYADHIDAIMGATDGERGRMHRVTHTDDGVTQIPTRLQGYRHHRTEYWERNTMSGGESASRTVRCFGQESPFCSDRTHPRHTSSLGVNKAHGLYSGVSFHTRASCQNL